ncbi:MAG: SH3 domain-containing protein [Barnesiella intestinihominis]
MKTITRIQTVLFGFILSSFMCAVCSAEVVSYRAVSVSNLNVREQPSVQSEKIGTITKSDTVIVESVEDAWAKINFNGKVAYVNANYLEEVEVGNLAEKDENLSFLKNILPLPLYGERWTWIVNANVAMTFVWAIFICRASCGSTG